METARHQKRSPSPNAPASRKTSAVRPSLRQIANDFGSCKRAFVGLLSMSKIAAALFRRLESEATLYSSSRQVGVVSASFAVRCEPTAIDHLRGPESGAAIFRRTALKRLGRPISSRPILTDDANRDVSTSSVSRSRANFQSARTRLLERTDAADAERAFAENCSRQRNSALDTFANGDANGEWKLRVSSSCLKSDVPSPAALQKLNVRAPPPRPKRLPTRPTPPAADQFLANLREA